jgi:hypothetical protein
MNHFISSFMNQVARGDSLEVTRKAMPQQQHQKCRSLDEKSADGSPAVLTCEAQKVIVKRRNAEPSPPVNYDHMTREALLVANYNVVALILAKRQAIRELRIVNTIGLLRTKSLRLRKDLIDLELHDERIVKALMLKEDEMIQDQTRKREAKIRFLISQGYDVDIRSATYGSIVGSQHAHQGDHGFSYGGYSYLFDRGAWDDCDEDGE